MSRWQLDYYAGEGDSGKVADILSKVGATPGLSSFGSITVTIIPYDPEGIQGDPITLDAPPADLAAMFNDITDSLPTDTLYSAHIVEGRYSAPSVAPIGPSVAPKRDQGGRYLPGQSPQRGKGGRFIPVVSGKPKRPYVPVAERRRRAEERKREKQRKRRNQRARERRAEKKRAAVGGKK